MGLCIHSNMQPSLRTTAVGTEDPSDMFEDLISTIIFRWPRYLASLRGHVASVYQIAWSADSRLLVSGSSDSTLKVWDVKAQKLATDLPGHADEVRLTLVGKGWVWN